MAAETPEQDWSESELSWLTGASSNPPPAVTQQHHRHQLVHRDAANAASEHMTHNAHLIIVRKRASSKNKTQHAIGCE